MRGLSDHNSDRVEKARAYANGPTRELSEQAKQADLATVPADADVADVGRAIVKLIDMPFGTRPLRMTVDPADGGAEELNKLGDRVRAAYLIGAGIGDLLHPVTRVGE